MDSVSRLCSSGWEGGDLLAGLTPPSAGTKTQRLLQVKLPTCHLDERRPAISVTLAAGRALSPSVGRHGEELDPGVLGNTSRACYDNITAREGKKSPAAAHIIQKSLWTFLGRDEPKLTPKQEAPLREERTT